MGNPDKRSFLSFGKLAACLVKAFYSIFFPEYQLNNNNFLLICNCVKSGCFIKSASGASLTIPIRKELLLHTFQGFRSL